ncbi:MAG TPA: 3-hydroxybutyryl-CoA dehydrogenase [candidate division Zixibacteria bacterium]|nr:3-hydroxybutyryl-CoA dehydrogenase [candidate division Zixibacteria bacterium]
MSFSKVAVVGAGVMGQGIAQTVASMGTEVQLFDVNEDQLKVSLKSLSDEMDHEIERWGMTSSEKKAILSRIRASSHLDEICGAPLVIEAIPEDIAIKKELFARLDAFCPQETIFVTNTSTLSITEIGAATKRPDRVIGLHFLNPVPKIPLVEIVKGLRTSDDTYNKIQDFARSLGKTPVKVFEYPGYVTTRIIVPLLNEAMHVLMEGVATATDIDNAIKLGYGFNIGPLALADKMGLDVVMDWMENLLNELSDHKYNPCPLLRKMVRAGNLGVKTGQGFFKYDGEGNKITEEQER